MPELERAEGFVKCYLLRPCKTLEPEDRRNGLNNSRDFFWNHSVLFLPLSPRSSRNPDQSSPSLHGCFIHHLLDTAKCRRLCKPNLNKGFVNSSPMRPCQFQVLEVGYILQWDAVVVQNSSTKQLLVAYVMINGEKVRPFSFQAALDVRMGGLMAHGELHNHKTPFRTLTWQLGITHYLSMELRRKCGMETLIIGGKGLGFIVNVTCRKGVVV